MCTWVHSLSFTSLVPVRKASSQVKGFQWQHLMDAYFMLAFGRRRELCIGPFSYVHMHRK